MAHSLYHANSTSPGLWMRAASATLRLAHLLDFISRPYGSAYGIGACARARLVLRLYRTIRTIPAGTTAHAQLVLAREILSLPPTLVGDVIECGVWKGASSITLSLLCQMVDRRLLVCDSFQGLPATDIHDYIAPHRRVHGYLKSGMFCGSLSEVRTHIAALGAIAVCEFIPGFFATSLQQLTRPIACAVLDVDLPSSFHDCLRAIWPLLVENGAIYIDDAGSMAVARVFFDDHWWQTHLACPAPGMIGSGCGLPISAFASNLGYTRKWPSLHTAYWQREADLFYPTESSDQEQPPSANKH